MWGGASLTYDDIVRFQFVGLALESLRTQTLAVHECPILAFHVFKYLAPSKHRSVSTVSETNRLCYSPCHPPPEPLRAVDSRSSNQSVHHSPQGLRSQLSVCQSSRVDCWVRVDNTTFNFSIGIKPRKRN